MKAARIAIVAMMVLTTITGTTYGQQHQANNAGVGFTNRNTELQSTEEGPVLINSLKDLCDAFKIPPSNCTCQKFLTDPANVGKFSPYECAAEEHQYHF